MSTTDSGEVLRDAGIAATLTHLDNTTIETIRDAITAAALLNETFTTDDVEALLGEGAKERLSAFPNAMGGIMQKMAKYADQIEATGQYVPSKKPSRRHAPVRVWRRILSSATR